MNNVLTLLGRIGLSAIFIISGLQKIMGYAATQGYMQSVGVPGFLLPLVILVEVGAGLAVLTGYQTRCAAYVLAAFSIVSAVIFHHNLADQMQFINFWKNIAIAGGFLLLAANSAGKYSIDAKRNRAA